jgi:hypothetical protein
MRRLNLALVALTIPAASLAAQVMIPTRGRVPTRPAEKPPQAPGIHDARLYNRYMLSRFSLESTPMLSYMQTTGLVAQGIPQNYWSFGDATLISFRAAPSLFVTSAFTAASLGTPFGVEASDVGLRLKPWTSPRVAVFADARMSWAFTTDFALPSQAVPIVALYRAGNRDFTTGSGKGGVFGLGTEVRLTDRYSLTTSLTYAHYSMRGINLTTSDRWTYTNDATRLMIGARYNHGHWYDGP